MSEVFKFSALVSFLGLDQLVGVFRYGMIHYILSIVCRLVNLPIVLLNCTLATRYLTIVAIERIISHVDLILLLVGVLVVRHV